MTTRSIHSSIVLEYTVTLLAVFLTVSVCSESDYTLLWAQHSHSFSRVRAVTSDNPRSWDNYTTTTHHRGPFQKLTRYTAIAYDNARQYVYWSDQWNKRVYQQRYASMAVGSEESRRVVYTGNVVSLSVDYRTGNVYYADVDERTIGVISARSDQQPAAARALVHHQEDATAVVVDVARSKVYWATSGPRTHRTQGTGIHVADLNGENSRVFRDDRYYYGYAKSLWLSGEFLYCIDRHHPHEEDSLIVKKYDLAEDAGDDRLGGLRPDLEDHTLVMFDDYVAISTSTSLKIKLYMLEDDGERVSDELETEIETDAEVYGMVVKRDVPQLENPCADAPCMDICLAQGAGYQCICREEYLLKADDKTCINSRSRYIYSEGLHLRDSHVKIDDITGGVIRNETRVLRDELNSTHTLVQALGYHYTEQYVYLAEIRTSTMYRTNPDVTREAMMDVTVNTGDVIGIAVDWLRNHMYWSDRSLRHIMCANLDGRYHSIILDDLDAPRGLAVDPYNNKLFWVSGSSIYASRLDGSDPHEFLSGVGSPQGITVDVNADKNRLYWTNPSSRLIEYINTDGSAASRNTITINSNEMYDVTVYQDYTTLTTSSLVFHSQITERVLDDLSDPAAAATTGHQLYDIINYDSYLQPEVEDEKQVPCYNHRCEQMCYSERNQEMCGCAIGFTLNIDGRSCDTVSSSGLVLQFVDPYHKQVYHMSAQRSRITRGDAPRAHGFKLGMLERPVSAAVHYDSGSMAWVDRYRMALLYGNEQEHTTIQTFTEETIPETIVSLQTTPTQLCYHSVQMESVICVDKSGTARTIQSDVSSSISVSQLTGSPVGVQPSGILLYVMSNGQNTAVVRLDVTNNHRDVIYRMDNITIPSAATVDVNGTSLYWSDLLSGGIFHLPIDLSGTEALGEATVIYADDSFDINTLAADESTVYFTTANTKSVYAVSLDTYAQYEVEQPMYARITDIKFIDADLIKHEPFVADDGGLGIPLYLVILLAALLGLLLLGAPLVAFLIMRRKRQQPKQTLPPGDTSMSGPRPMSGVLDVDEAMFASADPEATVGMPPSGGGVGTEGPEYANDGYQQEGSPQSTSSPSSPRLPAVIPPPTVLKPNKYKKNPRRSKDSIENTLDPTFEISNDAKVATVIQRLTSRLRNRLSSVRYSGDASSSPQMDPQDGNPPTPPDATAEEGTAPGAQPYEKPQQQVRMDVPPQLHRLPQGYAPASRVVPSTTLKSTWGRGKVKGKPTKT